MQSIASSTINSGVVVVGTPRTCLCDARRPNFLGLRWGPMCCHPVQEQFVLALRAEVLALNLSMSRKLTRTITFWYAPAVGTRPLKERRNVHLMW